MLIDKDTQLYCSFAKEAGSTGCAYHNAGFQKLNINAIYKSFSVNNIRDAVMAMKTLDIRGAGITMPFKKEVLRHVYHPGSVYTIGAANTIVNENGILIAKNTDWLAIKDFFTECEWKGCVYILGNGGYASAARFALDELRIKHKTITRRNWDEIPHLTDCTVFNCTPAEGINVQRSVKFIDCTVSTPTGKKLAELQAGYQFKLYTGMDYPC